jgi:hypothetical protein
MVKLLQQISLSRYSDMATGSTAGVPFPAERHFSLHIIKNSSEAIQWAPGASLEVNGWGVNVTASI